MLKNADNAKERVIKTHSFFMNPIFAIKDIQLLIFLKPEICPGKHGIYTPKCQSLEDTLIPSKENRKYYKLSK